MPDENRHSLDRVYVLVCKGDDCSRRGNPEKVRVSLKQAVREFPAKSVKVSYVSCLGLCGEGPNVLVCGEGAVFNRCEAGDLEGLVREVRGKLGRNRS